MSKVAKMSDNPKNKHACLPEAGFHMSNSAMDPGQVLAKVGLVCRCKRYADIITE
jgi:hypothetical protein